MSDSEQRIVEEFHQLIDRSQQLFSGLRDLPQFGKQWQAYFQRAFEVYTKLWKFQQTHRAVLENKDRYGIKRWEIGEIASKIAQLYYHYYLRTSETNYLLESFVFYDAIRARAYFKDVLDAKSPMIMLKKLRYYARFIIVCLLLGKRTVVRELADELQTAVDEYIKAFRPTDAQEWQFVLQEIALFSHADSSFAIDARKAQPLHFSARLQLAHEESKIKVQEVVVVGNQQQVKFSELTIDMFRIMQALEREPMTSVVEASQEGAADSERTTKKRSNVHKYLLYRPSFSQLLLYLSNAFKDIGEGAVLLLYISADGLRLSETASVTNVSGGGLSLSTRRPTDKLSVGSPLPECLYSADLFPFLRKNFFAIVESDNSAAFSSVPNVFGKPFLFVLSPTDHPTEYCDPAKNGSLLTYFLHEPVAAFGSIVAVQHITDTAAEACREALERAYEELHKLILSSNETPFAFIVFLQDEFLRLFILRFVLLRAVCRSHKHFLSKREYWPTTNPELPDSIIDSAAAIEAVSKLATNFGASDQFEMRVAIQSTASTSESTTNNDNAPAESVSGSSVEENPTAAQ